MTIKEALFHAHGRLKSAGNDSSWLDAELLLAHALNQPRAYLTSHAHDPLPRAAIQQYHHSIARRLRGEPVAYITREKEFYGLTFKISSDVFIPRPATEELVEHVVAHCRGEQCSLSRGRGLINRTPTIIDVGTGSGCIAVTCAKRFPASRIIATDQSIRALTVARENAQRHNISDRITFMQGELLAPVLSHFQNDSEFKIQNSGWILVANLPYVPTSTLNSKPELQFEPTTALDGGPDGIQLYRRLFQQLIPSLRGASHHAGWSIFPSLIALEADIKTIPALLASPEAKLLSQWYTIHHDNSICLWHLQTH